LLYSESIGEVAGGLLKHKGRVARGWGLVTIGLYILPHILLHRIFDIYFVDEQQALVQFQIEEEEA